jgi:hypothetical protein
MTSTLPAYISRLARINEKSRYYGFIGFGMVSAFAMAWRMTK